MLDIRRIRSEPEVIKAGARKKRINADEFVDQAIAIDERRRAVILEVEGLKAEQNRVGKEIAKLKGDEKASRIKAMGELAQRAKDLDSRLAALEVELEAVLLRIPNVPDQDVPEGANDQENVELRRWGKIPEFAFPWKDHMKLGEELDLVDFDRAAKLAGTRTYILKNEGALLELAVLNFTLQHLVKKGFGPMIVPTLVRRAPMVGTAYFPGGEEQCYACERDELFLVGTSEVPVTSYHMGEVLEDAQLPRLYAGYSTCYRREAGAAGRDTKGLYRIHQFNKVEQVVICRADEAESKRWHESIVQNAEEILQALELPYRVVKVCGGDLGGAQIFKYDIETWMPSRGGYGETHSASRFYDYQARRLNLRYRDAEGRVRFCHTLNNTAIASPRVLIPILEIYQEADGRVRVPEALRPFMGGLAYIERKE